MKEVGLTNNRDIIQPNKNKNKITAQRLTLSAINNQKF